MAIKKNSINDLIKSAFELAKINLGSTGKNPSVGCIIERNGTVLSSGFTSIGGRPHAEFNALNKKKINFKGANAYITLEPCSHYGKTPPCTNIIKNKKIKKVFFSINDLDERSKNLSKKILFKDKIYSKKNILRNYGNDFYKSYILDKENRIPLIDGKIAISKDFFTKDKKKKFITNEISRKTGQLLRSRYDCLITTSNTINDDNSIMDVRINGLEEKSPALVIIDRNLKLKKNLRLFKIKKKKQIYVVTLSKNKKKISFLKKKRVKIITVNSLNSKKDFVELFLKINRLGFSRFFLESGLNIMNFFIKNKFINYLYVFMSHTKIKKRGINYGSNNLIKKMKFKNKIKINLKNNELYKVQLK